jgi:hypothetical protein
MSIQYSRGILILTAVLSLQACNKGEKQMAEQAVIVHFTYGSTDLTRLYALEDELEQKLADGSVGEYDGHEIAVDGSDGTFYLYGPDARRVYEEVKDILTKSSFMNGAEVTLRYGPPEDGVRQEVLVIGQENDSAP